MIKRLHSDVYNGYEKSKIGDAVNELIDAHNSTELDKPKFLGCKICLKKSSCDIWKAIKQSPVSVLIGVCDTFIQEE